MPLSFTSAERTATRILELGTQIPFVRDNWLTDWAANVELHCTGDRSEGFDQDLVCRRKKQIQSLNFLNTGSEIEINDDYGIGCF